MYCGDDQICLWHFPFTLSILPRESLWDFPFILPRESLWDFPLLSLFSPGTAFGIFPLLSLFSPGRAYGIFPLLSLFSQGRAYGIFPLFSPKRAYGIFPLFSPGRAHEIFPLLFLFSPGRAHGTFPLHCYSLSLVSLERTIWGLPMVLHAHTSELSFVLSFLVLNASSPTATKSAFAVIYVYPGSSFQLHFFSQYSSKHTLMCVVRSESLLESNLPADCAQATRK